MGAARQHSERLERLVLGGLADLGKLREVVRLLLLDCAQDDVIDAVLVADELGTLACEYGTLPVDVSVSRSYARPALRIAMNSPYLGLPISPSRSRTSRRVLEACAIDWGIGNEHEGTTLWACVQLPSAVPEPEHDGFPEPRVSAS